MSIEWNDNLATGVAEIDAQHKELFKRFATLLKSCNEGKGKEEVLRLVTFLDEYIKIHFATEEGLQSKSGYPGYPEHKAQHRKFTDDVQHLISQVIEDGPTLSLVILTNKTLANWLVEHISKTDMAFAHFLQQQR